MAADEQRTAASVRERKPWWPGSGGVLDLRTAHVGWELRPGTPTSVCDPVLADMHGSYDAILRDGRFGLWYRPEQGRSAGVWLESQQLTRESLRRLRDTINAYLEDE